MNLRELLTALIGLLNENQGVLAVVLFLGTLLLGWASGLFKALRNKPNLKIRVIENGPSFYSIVWDRQDARELRMPPHLYSSYI